jgi:hypothetical protein
MFCDPRTPPYHALSMPDGVAPFTSSATRATTMTVRMTANKYGSGMKRSTNHTQRGEVLHYTAPFGLRFIARALWFFDRGLWLFARGH